MNNKRYLCLFFVFIFYFTEIIFAQTAELEVYSVFNNEFAKIKDKIKTAKDTITTLRLPDKSDKLEVDFYIPKGTSVVSVISGGLAQENVKVKDGFLKVDVNGNKRREVVVTTRKIDDPVYTDSKIPLWDIKKRVGSFTLELPMPSIEVGTTTFKISGPKNLFFIDSRKVEALVKIGNWFIENKNIALIVVGVIALILIKFVFRYIGRLFKMIIWFICWPAKRIKPAGFVVLFLMFAGVVFYISSSVLPSLQNQIPTEFDEIKCETIRKEYEDLIYKSKDTSTDNLQTLFEKGVIKKISGCPQFGFYVFDNGDINCTVHGKGEYKSKLLSYQIKLPETLFSDTVKATSLKMATPLKLKFYYADKAVVYIVGAVLALISFFFFFIPIILGKPLDASYAKLFKKKGQPQQRGGMGF